MGLLFAAGVFAQEAAPPKPAADLLKDAYAKASKEKKSVFVIFDASW